MQKANQIEAFQQFKNKLPLVIFEKNRARFIQLFKEEIGAQTAVKGIALL